VPLVAANTVLLRLVLASGSPRRQELLRDAGYDFIVSPADIDEENHPARLSPADLAAFLARAKAGVVADRYPDAVVLAADTVVALGSESLGKPLDAAEARNMLRRLSGTTHEVITGVAVARRASGLHRDARVMSQVHMRRLSDGEIDAYVASGQWEGKAGGYGIQDQDPFVTRTSGCHSNIVGLPMTTTKQLLRDAGIVSNA
jgi:septum formation protein